MRERATTLLHHLSKPAIAIGGSLVIGALLIGAALQMSATTPSGQYTAAVIAPIVGKGGESSDLSFQVSGQVVSIPVSIGQVITGGAVLVSLDQSSLRAARAGAVANLEAAQARFNALKSGTRPEQLAVDQTAVAQGQESLRDAVRSAYVNADDAIHNKVDQFFINPRTASAALSFIVTDQVLQNTVESGRIALESVLNTWGTQINDSGFASSDPLAAAQLAQTDLAQVSAFLDTVASALAKSSVSSKLPLATLQGYQTNVTTARLNISGSVSAITAATTGLVNAQGALTLASAGPTANDVAAAQAVVDAAQAVLGGIDVSLRQATLVSPMTGTVIVLNAHLGQTVTPGQILVSIESSGGSKQDALVIPKSSVIEDSGQAFVYVKSDKGVPIKTVVTTGLVSAQGMMEVLTGLSAGQEVLTFGTSTP
jgi:multidrug efflux pump subunit AcrA (membrane-fusion protein)